MESNLDFELGLKVSEFEFENIGFKNWKNLSSNPHP
jgi:hypothetical protein